MTVDKMRQDAQPAFVLHTYPYLETSLLVETFTRNLGRVPLVAKGAKRPKSALRGLLIAFQPLQLTWAGKSELRTLHKAEWQGGQQPLQGTALICGFYLNVDEKYYIFELDIYKKSSKCLVLEIEM